MPYAFGTLRERFNGALFHFIPDGTVISTIIIGKAAKPAYAAFTEDYSLGRVNNSKYVPQTKDRKREWALPTGGYKERTTKTVTEDAYEITVIDFATALFDQLAYGLVGPAVAEDEQQAFASATRYKDGWARIVITEEGGGVGGVLTLHVRLEIQTVPELKSEDGSPVWKVTHLADAGALDTYTPYPPTAFGG